MIFEETVYDERNGLDTISLALKDLYVNFVITFLFFRSYPTISTTIVAQLMILDASKANSLQCSEDQLVGSCFLSNLDHFNRVFVVQ